MRSTFLLVLCVGCTSGDHSPSAISVDTLPNGAIHVGNPAQGLWGDASRWRLVEEVRLGSVDAEDTLLNFADIWDLALDKLGRIYVLDRQAKSVRVFDNSGAHVRTLGRDGQGPGEFTNPVGMDWGPDGHLWIADFGNARYEVFDTAGNYLISHRREVLALSYPWGGGFDPSGRLYEPSYTIPSGMRGARGLYVRHNVTDGLEPTDTFDLPHYDPTYYRVNMNNGYMVLGVPFMPDLKWRFDGIAGIWFAVSDDYRLIHRTLSGDTTMIVSRAYTPIPVTDSDRERALRRFDELSDAQMKQVDLSLIPNVKPAFQSFLVDDRGYPWVVRTSEQPQVSGVAFDIFDDRGRYLGLLSAPIGYGPPPRFYGDRVLGVARDSLLVPYVVLLRIAGR